MTTSRQIEVGMRKFDEILQYKERVSNIKNREGEERERVAVESSLFKRTRRKFRV